MQILALQLLTLSGTLLVRTTVISERLSHYFFLSLRETSEFDFELLVPKR